MSVQVKGLAFNQLSPNLLASGGADGDIIIWDVANPRKPTAFPPLKVFLLCMEFAACAAVAVATANQNCSVDLMTWSSAQTQTSVCLHSPASDA